MYAIRAKNGQSFRRSGLTFLPTEWSLIKHPSEAQLNEPQLEVVKSVKGDDDPRLNNLPATEVPDPEEPEQEQEATPAATMVTLTATEHQAIQDRLASLEKENADLRAGGKAAGASKSTGKAAGASKSDDSAPLHGTESDPGATPTNAQPGAPNINEAPTADMGPNVSQLTPEQSAVQGS